MPGNNRKPKETPSTMKYYGTLRDTKKHKHKNYIKHKETQGNANQH